MTNFYSKKIIFVKKQKKIWRFISPFLGICFLFFSSLSLAIPNGKQTPKCFREALRTVPLFFTHTLNSGASYPTIIPGRMLDTERFLYPAPLASPPIFADLPILQEPFLNIPQLDKDSGSGYSEGNEEINLCYLYEDQDINELLRLRALEVRLDLDTNILMPPLDDNTSLLAGQLEEERDRYLARLSNGDAPRPRNILLPLNLPRLNHWIGVFIRLNGNNHIIQAQYLDSLGHSCQQTTEYSANMSMSLQRLSEALKEVYGGNVAIENLPGLIQTDGAGCGPLTVENLILAVQGLLNNENNESIVDQEEMREIRARHIALADLYEPNLNLRARQRDNICSFNYKTTAGNSERVQLLKSCLDAALMEAGKQNSIQSDIQLDNLIPVMCGGGQHEKENGSSDNQEEQQTFFQDILNAIQMHIISAPDTRIAASFNDLMQSVHREYKNNDSEEILNLAELFFRTFRSELKEIDINGTSLFDTFFIVSDGGCIEFCSDSSVRIIKNVLIRLATLSQKNELSSMYSQLAKGIQNEASSDNKEQEIKFNLTADIRKYPIKIDSENPTEDTAQEKLLEFEARHNIFEDINKATYNDEGEEIKNVKLKSLANKMGNLRDKESALTFKKDELDKINRAISERNSKERIGTELEKEVEELQNEAGEISLNDRTEIAKRLEVKKKELAKTKKEITKLRKESSKRDKKESEIKKLEESIAETNKQYDKLDSNEKEQVDSFLASQNLKKKIVLYKQIFQFCKVIADQVEKNSHGNDDLAYSNAYKILVFFEDKDLGSVIKKFDKCYPGKKLHDALAAVNLPSNGALVSLNEWREFFTQYGVRAIRIFARADDIEKKKANNEGVAASHLAPKNIEEAESIKGLLVYPRGNEYKLLAEVCSQYNVQEEVFNSILELNQKRKTKDSLPDIKVNGAKVNREGYWLVKLPIGDPRAYILGQITNCCQSIGGDSERCVIDGVTREHNGFYVLLHEIEHNGRKGEDPIIDGKIDYVRYKIAGQGYAWLSKAGNLVFDSWESSRPEERYDPVAVDLLRKFGEIVSESEHSKVSRVTIGKGGKTPDYFRRRTAVAEDIMKEGHQYGDSLSQSVVYKSVRLYELGKAIDKKLVDVAVENIISFEPGNNFLNFTKSDKNLASIKELGGRVGDLSRVVLMLCQNEDDDLESLVSLLLKVDTYEKLQTLFSQEAQRLYTLGFVKLRDLQDLSIKKIKVLTSGNANTLYQTGVKFSELVDLDAKKIEVLISYDVIRIYQAGVRFLKLKELLETDVNKFTMLTSGNANTLYQTGVKFSELVELDAKKIEALISEDALRAYQDGVRFSELVELDAKKIEALISNSALTAYQAGVRFSELKELLETDANKFAMLTSGDANGLYRIGVKFSELVGLDTKKIGTLVSKGALRAYQNGVRFSELKELLDKDADKFAMLTSDNANSLYRIGVKFSELVELDTKKIEALTCYTARESYRKDFLTFVNLKDLSVEKIKVLVSKGALRFYMNKFLSFEDLKELDDLEEITALTSLDSFAACLSGATFLKLKDLYENQRAEFVALTSKGAVAAYIEGFEDKDEIEECSLSKPITVSKNAREKYESLRFFYKYFPDEFKTLTSEAAIRAYEGGVRFLELENLYDENNKDKFAALTSEAVIRAYEVKVRFHDLVNLYNENNKDKFEALTSDGALQAYRSYPIFQELKGIYENDRDKFTALTSDGSLHAYRRCASFQELNYLYEKDFNKFKKLTSEEAAKVYAAGVSFKDFKMLYDIYQYKLKASSSMEEASNLKADFDLSILLYLSQKEVSIDGLLAAYGAGATLKDLKYLYENDPDKFKVLTTRKTWYIDEDHRLKFTDLRELDIEKINLLVSDEAAKAYLYGISILDLLDLDASMIRILISNLVIAGYGSRIFSLDDLKVLDFDLLDMLVSRIKSVIPMMIAGATLQDIKYLYEHDKGELNALADNTERTIYPEGCSQYLWSNKSSGDLRRQISSGKFRALKELYENDREKFKVLTSERAKYAYREGASFQDLLKLEIEKIRVIISEETINVCGRWSSYKLLSFTDLFVLEVDKIKALTSKAVVDGLIKKEDLLDLEAGKTKLLTSERAVRAYRAGITFKDLKDFDIKKIEALISYGAQEAYRYGARLPELIEVWDKSPEKFSTLVSYEAREAYRLGIKFGELKDFDIEKIKELISPWAYRAYQSGSVTFENLKTLTVDEIKKRKVN